MISNFTFHAQKTFSLALSLGLLMFILPFSLQAQTSRYVNASTGNDANTGTLVSPYKTIQKAVNESSDSDIIEVSSGNYNEQVIVNKKIKLKGVGATKPKVNYTGTVGTQKSIFQVVADEVEIDNFEMNVDLTKLSSGIVVTGAAIDKITITNNTINPVATSSAAATTFGLRNAISINYAANRVATGGVDNIIVTNNTVTASLNDGFGGQRLFRSAVSVDEGSTATYTGNDFAGQNHDITFRFNNGGDVLIQNNNFRGGGVEIGSHNSGAGKVDILNNTFNSFFASLFTSSMRLQYNNQGKQTNISGNTFANHNWGISLENYKSVAINNNTFTPLNNSTTYRHITINTKVLVTDTPPINQTAIDGIFTNNTFNGSGTIGGSALAFYNHDDANDTYGTFTIGSSGNENTFNDGIANFILLGSETGPTTGLNASYGYTGIPSTTAACWTQELNAEFNKYNVGSGAKLPAAMTGAERTTLETYIYHKPDNACLSRVISFLPVNNITQSTSYVTIAEAISAANPNDVLVVAPGNYSENLIINKPLTINGANVGKLGTDLTRGDESVLVNGRADLTATGVVVIDGFKFMRDDALVVDVVIVGGGSTATITNNIFERNGSATGIVARAITTSAGAAVKTISNNLFTGTTSGGLFSGHKTWNNAMYVNGATGTVNIQNNTFENNRTALNIDDHQAGIKVDGNTFDNNGTHMAFGGTTPTTGSYTLDANNFKQTFTFINLSNVADDFRLNITSSNYKGTALSSATNADLFTIEAQMYHKGFSSRKGKVIYKANNQYVNNFTTPATKIDVINNSIKYADANDIINLQGGTYNQRVVIDKSDVTLQGIDADETLQKIDGTGLTGNGDGIQLANGIKNVTIKQLTVQNFSGLNGNSDAGIYAIGGNDGLKVDDVVIKNNVGGSGIYANGPVDGVSITNSLVEGHTTGARGIVIWNGFKQNITITGNTVKNNNCCGIELQDGSASGVTISNNIVTDNGDSGIGLIGLTGPLANIISNNTVTNNGRFGIEIKNPNGSGALSGPGSVVVDGNTVSRTVAITDLRDIAGISIYRRGITGNNVDIPYGVVVSNNTVTGFTQGSTSDGFGIVVEGINHQINNNTVTGNDVGIQRQAGHLPYPADGDQTNLNDQYFGRGNSAATCGVTLTGNTLSGNTLDTRDVGNSNGTGVVVNTNSGKPFCSIQAAINDVATLNGHVIEASSGIYNEQVLVNKEVTIRGVGATKPIIDFTATVTGKPTIFDVSANNVTVENLNFKVDLSKLKSAVIASAAGIDNITVKDNLIEAYGTPSSGTYGDRNAVSVNYGGSTNYRVATAGVNSVSFTGNTVSGTLPSSFFRAGIAADEVGLTATGNTLQSINHDIIVRFASNGNVTASDNNLNGGGMEFGDFNAGAGTLTITNNTFNGAVANTYSNALRLKNNYTARPTIVSSNTFTGFEGNVAGYGGTVSLENYQAITLDNNTFTPLVNSTVFRHVTINTKDFSSSSGSYQPNVGAILTNNIFNGSGTIGGTALSFANQDNDNPIFGTFVVGTAGNENNFKAGVQTFIKFENLSGTVSPNATTAAPWNQNIDATNNIFDGKTGATATLAENFAIEDKIVHKVDNATLGLVRVKAAELFVTTNSGNIQRAVDAATAADVVNVNSGSYTETVTVNKALLVKGVNMGIAGTATRSAEAILTGTFKLQASDITIDGFQITGAGRAVEATGTGPWSNIKIMNNRMVSNTGQQAILNGFGVVANTIGSANWEIKNNFVSDLQLNDATVFVLFDIDGLNIDDNVIEHKTATFTGRRGLNVDGGKNVNIRRNSIDLGLTNPAADNSDGAFTNTRYNLQLSSGNRTTENILVDGNTMKGSYDAIITLGNGNFTNVKLTNNKISDMVLGIRFQAGTNTNPGEHKDFIIANNDISSANRSIYLQNGGAGTMDAYNNINVSENSLLRMTSGVALEVQAGSVLTAAVPIAATCNWFGTTDPLLVKAQIIGDVNFLPFTTNGMDDQPATTGFQPVAGSCNGFGPVKLYTDNTLATLTSSFFTIQAAVNAASNGNAIVVDAGTYNEQVIVNRALTILGPNSAVSPNTGTRVAEAVLTNISTGRAFSISSGNTDVTISGFKFDGGSPIHDGNDTNNPNTSDVTFSKNLVVNANQIYAGTSTSWADLIITDNKFQDINATATSNAMQVSHTLTTTITDNTFANVNYAAIAIDATPTVTISGNNINGTGFQAIQLAGAIGTATVKNNKINDANRVAQAVDRGAIRLYGSAFTGAVSISNNDITGGYNGIAVRNGENITGKNITVTENSITGLAGGKAMYNGATSGVLSTTCNWFGTTSSSDIANKVGGNVTFDTFLINGTDNEPTITGFQPVPNSCTGSAVIITSVSVPVICSVNGSAIVLFSGGTAPYNVSWTDGGANTGSVMSVTSPYTVVDLPPAAYSFTITDANGSMATQGNVAVTVFRIPVAPIITTDNSEICKGTNAVLSASCDVATDIFRWSTPPTNQGNETSNLSSTGTQIISTPGTYTGYCTSVNGCVSQLGSVTIAAGAGCDNQNFIVITPELPTICPGGSIALTATGCSGTVNWVALGSSVSGTTVTLNPAATTTYAVSCSSGGSTSIEVKVAQLNIVVNNNISTGKTLIKAVNTIESDKKIGNPNITPAPNVIYEAGNAIILKPGFVAEGAAIFKAEIKGCN